MSSSPESFLQDVRNQGWASVDFPVTYRELTELADLFLDFCTLPQDHKTKLLRYLDPNDEVSRVGYFRRAQANGNFDDKEVWHHHTQTTELLSEEPLWSDPKVLKFAAAADKVLKLALPVMQSAIGNFEHAHPGLLEKFFPNGGAPKTYLRFVKYIPQKTGEFLAKGHFDRGCSTLAICESAPGLRLGKDVASLKPYEYQEKRAVFFPALSFPALTDTSFAPVWHDVIQKSEDQYRPDCARWAIVLFADAIDLKSPSVAEARRLLY